MVREYPRESAFIAFLSAVNFFADANAVGWLKSKNFYRG